MLRRSFLIAGVGLAGGGLAAGVLPVAPKTDLPRLPAGIESQVEGLLKRHGLTTAGEWRQRGRVVTLFAEGAAGRYRVAVDLDQNAVIGLRASPADTRQAAR